MLTKNVVKSNEIEELNNISCPLCFSKLIFKSLNKNSQLLTCSNDECLFPLDNANMNKFVLNINNDNLATFLSNLKSLVVDQSCGSDTNMEDKLKKYKNEKFENDDYSEFIDARSFSNLLSQNDIQSN